MRTWSPRLPLHAHTLQTHARTRMHDTCRAGRPTPSVWAVSTSTLLHDGQGGEIGEAGTAGNAGSGLMRHEGAVTDEELLQACSRKNATKNVGVVSASCSRNI